MGLLKKQKANTNVETEVASTPKSKKKKKDMMSAILSESVMESALEIMRSAPELKVERNGAAYYIGMLLDANDESIGGINKKSRKDEAKGQIIELINSGRIATYIPEQLLNEEKLIIIPLITTLDAMDEFTLLTSANYTIVLTNDYGKIDDTGCAVTFTDMMSMVMDKMDAMTFLGAHGVAWAQATQQVSTPTVEESSDYEYESDSDFELDDENDSPFGSDEIASEDVNADADLGYDTNYDEPMYEDSEPQYENDIEYMADDAVDTSNEDVADAPVEEPEAEYDEEIADEKVEEAITRRFYSNDLGLEVTTEPFDAQFLHANTYVPFDENRGEGWLNAYLNEISKDANHQMQHMHQNNLLKLRELYYSLISKHCEQIQHDVDETDSSNAFGRTMDALRQRRMELDADVERRVAKEREEIDESWNRAIEQVGEDARRAAQQQYRERFGKQHDEDVYRIESKVRREIDDDFQDAVREFHDDQRKAALQKLDLGITATLAEVSNMYMECLAEESKEYDAHRERIMAFLDEHRKDDVAHAEVLKKELEQQDRMKQAEADFKKNLEQRTNEFNAERERLSRELEDMNTRMENRIKNMESEHDNRVSKLKKENEDLNAQLKDMMSKLTDIDAKKEREYSARLNEARDEKDAWASKCDNIMAMHRKSSFVTIGISVMAVVAALAIGIIFGMNAGIDKSSQEAANSISEEFQKRMTELEEKATRLEDDAKAKEEEAKKAAAEKEAEPTGYYYWYYE